MPQKRFIQETYECLKKEEGMAKGGAVKPVDPKNKKKVRQKKKI